MFVHAAPAVTSQTPTPWETPGLLLERLGGGGEGGIWAVDVAWPLPAQPGPGLRPFLSPGEAPPSSAAPGWVLERETPWQLDGAH